MFFYKKKKKKDQLDINNEQPKKKGLSERTISILVVVGLALISIVTALVNSLGSGELGDLSKYMTQFNQEVNVTITDPVAAVNEEVVKGKLFAAGLKTLSTKQDLVLEDLTSNAETLQSDLTLTQAQVGALFNIILKDDTYSMKIIELKVNKSEGNYSFESYASLNLAPLVSEIPSEYGVLFPESLTIKYNFYFTEGEQGFVAEDSDFRILNFSNEINEEVVKLFESILNEGVSVEQSINNALVKHLNDSSEGIIAWLGASGVVIEQGQVTFLKKVA